MFINRFYALDHSKTKYAIILKINKRQTLLFFLSFFLCPVHKIESCLEFSFSLIHTEIYQVTEVNDVANAIWCWLYDF